MARVFRVLLEPKVVLTSQLRDPRARPALIALSTGAFVYSWVAVYAAVRSLPLSLERVELVLGVVAFSGLLTVVALIGIVLATGWLAERLARYTQPGLLTLRSSVALAGTIMMPWLPRFVVLGASLAVMPLDQFGRLAIVMSFFDPFAIWVIALAWIAAWRVVPGSRLLSGSLFGVWAVLLGIGPIAGGWLVAGGFL